MLAASCRRPLTGLVTTVGSALMLLFMRLLSAMSFSITCVGATCTLVILKGYCWQGGSCSLDICTTPDTAFWSEFAACPLVLCDDRLSHCDTIADV